MALAFNSGVRAAVRALKWELIDSDIVIGFAIRVRESLVAMVFDESFTFVELRQGGSSRGPGSRRLFISATDWRAFRLRRALQRAGCSHRVENHGLFSTPPVRRGDIPRHQPFTRGDDLFVFAQAWPRRLVENQAIRQKL